MLEYRNIRNPCLGYSLSGQMRQKKSSRTLVGYKCVGLQEACVMDVTMACLVTFLVGLLRFQPNFNDRVKCSLHGIRKMWNVFAAQIKLNAEKQNP